MKSFIFASFAVALVVIAMIIGLNNADQFEKQHAAITTVAPEIAQATEGVELDGGKYLLSVIKFGVPVVLFIGLFRWMKARSDERERLMAVRHLRAMDTRQSWNSAHDPHSHTADGVRW